jgi:hypothetical protein
MDNCPSKPLPETYEELIYKISKTKYAKDAKEENGVKILYNGKFGKLLIPLTVETSCKYGKGTKWCTASEKAENYFHYYNQVAPLYIWISKKGKKKYQMYFPNLEIKDATNHNLRTKEFQKLRTNPILKELFEEKEKLILDEIAILDPEEDVDDNFNIGFNRYYLNYMNGEWPELEKRMKKDDTLNYTVYILLDGKISDLIDQVLEMYDDHIRGKKMVNWRIDKELQIKLNEWKVLISNYLKVVNKFGFEINQTDFEDNLDRLQEFKKYYD